MLRLGVRERGVTEILGVAEHVVSASAAADGLRLAPDVPAGGGGALAAPLIAVPDGPPDEARSTWREIAEWSERVLGADQVPAYWRAFSRRPRLLAAMWAKHVLVLRDGELTTDAKLAVALAVAMSRHSTYWTGYFAQAGRHAGVFDDDVVLEIAAATLHYSSFNTIAHGMMLEAPHRDLRASDVASEDGGTA